MELKFPVNTNMMKILPFLGITILAIGLYSCTPSTGGDHSQDQTGYKWGSNATLNTVGLSEMPDYLKENYQKYNSWLDI